MVIDYKGKPGPQKLPHTLFTEAPSVFDDMNEDDNQQAQASLSKALSNVINIKDWVGARDKTIPTFFEALIAANQPAANIDPDIGIFLWYSGYPDFACCHARCCVARFCSSSKSARP